MMTDNKEKRYQVECTYPDGKITYGESTDFNTAKAWADYAKRLYPSIIHRVVHEDELKNKG